MEPKFPRNRDKTARLEEDPVAGGILPKASRSTVDAPGLRTVSRETFGMADNMPKEMR